MPNSFNKRFALLALLVALLPASILAQGLWGKIDYKGEPWVSNASRPMDFDKGLEGRHITLWASHGRYYDNAKSRWEWQRPALFCTTEDLFTQTIVVPYLIPMLERAGAVVFTPRERDWQTAEYVIDRDGGLTGSAAGYSEYAEGQPWRDTRLPGFGGHAGAYVDNENPFLAGGARMMKATRKADKAFVKWQPAFAKSGRFAVYVSYQTVEGSVDDAHYTVFHRGQATEFRVNQRMGGGTWVYLGTFDFDAGNSTDNCVMLTSQSKRKGWVTADAVRFGGGMGNISRGGLTSGLPRALEGARYYAQWAGMPYQVYGGKEGKDDYADDINTRSRMLNWLGGGSVYMPKSLSLGVPFELSLAVHSDAGYSPDGNGLIGSLAICTTNFNDGRLQSGLSRQASKEFASRLLNNLTTDLTAQYGQWAKRYLWDRNYSETRLPEVPSAIIETLSHQNFPDMVLGQDPNFRFTMARSIYKTIARYVNDLHGHKTVIQPLAPTNIAVELQGKKAHVSWSAQDDPQESTAKPTAFIVYTSIGQLDFDNGTLVKGTSFDVKLNPGMQYNFRVTAVNAGGESQPTEVVSAFLQPNASQTVLVVNGFHRLSAPAVIDNAQQQGFDLDEDPGVSYGLTAGWCGRQRVFTRSRMGNLSTGGLGYSGQELAGHFVAGNDFDYVITHTEAIAATGKYNVVSCTSKAVEIGKVKQERYAAVDLILGLERWMPQTVAYYKAFTPSLQRAISSYLSHGGRLFVSGAYIGTDMAEQKDAAWLARTLKTYCVGQVKTDTIGGATGMGMQFDFARELNANHYAATRTDILQPANDAAFPAVAYLSGAGPNDEPSAAGPSAAVAYDGQDYKTFTLAFPFECITEKAKREATMKAILDFLTKKP